MKKKIFLLLVIVFLISFTACGAVQSHTEKSESLQKDTILETSDSTEISKESVSGETEESGNSVSTPNEQEKVDSPESEQAEKETTDGLTQKQKELLEMKKAERMEHIIFISDYVSDKAVLCQSTEGILAFQIEKRKLPGQWTEQGEAEFEVRGTEVQFHNENYTIKKAALEANVKQAIGKAVGQEFFLEHRNTKDGTFTKEIYRYVILEIKKSTQMGNRKETVEYGDVIRAVCYKGEPMEQNTAYVGDFRFQVEDGMAEFSDTDVDVNEELMEKIKEALLKYQYRVYDEEYVYYIREVPIGEEETGSSEEEMPVSILEGKTLQGYYYRQNMQGDWEREFLGSFWVKYHKNTIEWVKQEGEFTEEDIKKIEGILPVDFNEYNGSCYPVYDGDYLYQICFTAMIEEEDKPAFTIPEGWDYQFGAPRIGSFKDYDFDESASPIDMEGGCLFGYEDRMSAGCSTWCACSQYYCEAKVSSFLPAQGSITYGVENLNDAYRLDAWAEGVPGDGIGESFEIRELYLGGGDDLFRYNEMCIVNGYAKNETTWQENNRVKSLKLYFFDEYMGTITLEDTMLPQYIDLSPVGMRVGNGCEAKFRFEIAEVYKGTKYDDTCISGVVVEFEGRDAH